MSLYNVNGEEIEEAGNENFVKHIIKATVFSDLFYNPKYLMELYQALHPEDKITTESDLKDVTIRNVLVNDIVNDLGFRVGDRLLLLLEAQSTWSLNILVRVLMYLARTYQIYFKEQKADLYGEKKVVVPKPELYVIYIGDKKDIQDTISLADEFFGGDDSFLDLKIKVIKQTDSTDILNQYILFSKIYNEQRKLHGRSEETILKTIRICKDRNILKEYLESREKEVVDIMMTLFDEQEIAEMHDNSMREEGKIEALVSLVKDSIISISEAAKRLGVTEAKFKEYMK